MSHKITASFLLLLICLGSLGQKGSLTGFVRDSKGQPLYGAAVFVHDLRTGAVSDSLGQYRVASLPFGHYLVEVSFIGYGSVTESININGNVVHDFSLEEAVVEQQGVIVTGVATATKLKQATQPVTLLRRSDLLRTASTNIIDALAKEPGVSALTTGPAISKPVIRGLGYNRMVVISDGIRQEGQQWGDEHGIEIDEYSIQRAEILKGPASLMYGSDAMAGVINLVSNVPVEQGTVKGNMFGTYNGNNGLPGTNLNLAGHLKSGFNWNAYGSYKSAADYRNKYDGIVFNSRFNERNLGGYVGLNKQWGFSHLLLSYFNQHTGLIEGERDSASGKFLIFTESPLERIDTDEELESRKMFTPFQHITHLKLTTDNNIILPKGRMNVVIGFQQNKRREFGDATDPSTPGLVFDLETVNYNIQYHSPAAKGSWTTSYGLNGMFQKNRNLGPEVLIPEYSQWDGGVFVYTRKNYPRFTLSGGMRADIRNLRVDELVEGTTTKFNAFDRNFFNVSGSFGISYDINKELTFKVNLARAFRAPNVAELSSNGSHEGTDRYEYGQADLRSETSLQADAGLELNATHFGLNISAFYNNISDYIFYRKLSDASGNDSIVVVDGEPLTAFRFEQSGASLYGIEVGFDLHPHPLDWLHFENTFSYVRGKFHQSVAGEYDLPFMPPAKWNSELRTDFKKAGKSLQNLYLKAEIEHVFRQDDIFASYDTETASKGYTLLHFGLGADFRSRQRTLFNLHLALNNVTDVAFQHHLSRLKYTAENNVTGRQGVFNMGRHFSVKLNVPLSFRIN
jgi:iron complex outermembrane receptor protein